MQSEHKKLDVIYFFFEDDYYKWPINSVIDPFVDNNKEIRVIGVTYPVSIFTFFSNPMRFFKFLFKRSGNIRENVSFFAPFSILPVRLINLSPLFINIHRAIFKSQINRHLKKINAFENRITWIYSLIAFPAFGDSVGASRLLVYSCQDEYLIKENTPIKSLKKIEDNLLSKADLVFTLSKNVYEARKEKNKNCFLIPNGVDFNLFNRTDSPDTLVHCDLKNIPKPIVGYLGNIRSWLDFELLEFLADNLRDVSFAFVGPVARDVWKEVASLKTKKNIYLVPRKTRQELPSVLKAFDVCMIPFKYNKFNLATNPLKFWEYMACGKPILSLKIPDFEIYKDVIATYVNKEEALAKIRVLLAESDFGLKERRKNIAKDNDVSMRAKQYYEIILNYLKWN